MWHLLSGVNKEIGPPVHHNMPIPVIINGGGVGYSPASPPPSYQSLELPGPPALFPPSYCGIRNSNNLGGSDDKYPFIKLINSNLFSFAEKS